jgi:hypothetical protein
MRIATFLDQSLALTDTGRSTASRNRATECKGAKNDNRNSNELTENGNSSYSESRSLY